MCAALLYRQQDMQLNRCQGIVISWLYNLNIHILQNNNNKKKKQLLGLMYTLLLYLLFGVQLTLKPEQTVLPLVDKSNTVETRRGVTFQHPEILANADLVASTLTEPYYWKLPEQFSGSMVGKSLFFCVCVLFYDLYFAACHNEDTDDTYIFFFNPIKYSCNQHSIDKVFFCAVFRSQHMVGS